MSHPSSREIKHALESAKTAYSQSAATTYHLLRALEEFSSDEGEADLLGKTAETYAQGKQLSDALEKLQFDIAKLLSSVEK